MFMYKSVNLPCGERTATLDCYINDLNGARPAMLVIPGGGYEYTSNDREGYPVAEVFLSKGYNCFVLTYSIREHAKFPQPLNEASVAMEYIRDNAEALCVNPQRVFCVGFSAGGHLAGSLATLWHTVDCVKKGSNRPNGVILCYPVLTSKKGVSYETSFRVILGTQNPTEEELAKYSVENNIDERTCPVFLMHSADDQLVPVESTIYAAEALSRHKIPFEVHIYPHAPHGAVLANEITAFDNPGWIDESMAKWVDNAVYWLKKLPDNS